MSSEDAEYPSFDGWPVADAVAWVLRRCGISGDEGSRIGPMAAKAIAPMYATAKEAIADMRDAEENGKGGY